MRASNASKVGGSASVAQDDCLVVERPTARATGTIRKAKSALVIHDREPEDLPDSPTHPHKASVMLQELEGKLIAWSAEGYKLAQEVRLLREAYLNLGD
jgi:hypothetical protein